MSYQVFIVSGLVGMLFLIGSIVGTVILVRKVLKEKTSPALGGMIVVSMWLISLLVVSQARSLPCRVSWKAGNILKSLASAEEVYRLKHGHYTGRLADLLREPEALSVLEQNLYAPVEINGETFRPKWYDLAGSFFQCLPPPGRISIMNADKESWRAVLRTPPNDYVYDSAKGGLQ
ncbi:MAG: hypothetical protein KKB20_17410 [Proteobacteria bacterium]|nr:hypothetical protein [Pseudomonadota bacterium]